MKDELKYVTIEATGFRDLCQRMAELEEENRQLQSQLEKQAEELTNFISEIEDLEYKVDRLNRIKNGLRINNSALTLERNALLDELNHIKGLSMFEFGNRYCSSESLEADGHAFARSLLGHRHIDDELAENSTAPFNGDVF